MVKEYARLFVAAVIGLAASVKYALTDSKLARLGASPIMGADDIAGAIGTGNYAARAQWEDMGEEILELEPEATPLLVLTKHAGKDSVDSPNYSWWEDGPRTRFDQLNGAIADGVDTTIPVDNGGIWAADDVGFVTSTGEQFRVVSVAANTLTVVRGVGTTPVAIADNAEVMNIGSAAQEGALDKPARSSIPTEVTNYTQIFRTPVDATGTKRSSRERTRPHSVARARKKAGIEHAKDIEYALMLGRKAIDTTGTHPRRLTGGFDQFATQNITDMGGAMTEDELFSGLVNPFRRNPGSSKLAISAPNPIDVINGFPRAKLQVINPDPSLTYGIRVVQLITPHGVLNFVTHWLMEGSRLSEEIWLVDTKNIAYRYLDGVPEEGSRDTTFRPNIHAPGYDGKKDEYLTECGGEWGQPESHGKLVNIES